MQIDKIKDRVNCYSKRNNRLREGDGVRFFIARYENPTEFEAAIYSPVLCLILQGSKEMMIGERSVKVSEGELLIVSHELPVTSRITRASTASPYLAMILPINMEIIRSLYTEIPDGSLQRRHSSKSLEVSSADGELIDALDRYLCLQEKPDDLVVMQPLILKEIHYRLLMAPNGKMLQQMLSRDSHASLISKAITVIRQEYRNTLSVSDLAQIAGMSQSSFHERFKSIIGTTPLRYQKDLRLIEAKRLLSQGQYSIAGTAYEVGYESPSQFSREYARKFGCPPFRHLTRQTATV